MTYGRLRAIDAPISGPIGLERNNAMTAIQILCAVAVPLLWGYQFVAIKVGVTEFPPLFFLALRFLAIALLLVPFVKKPARRQFGPIAAISIFLGGLNFGLFYVGLGLGSGSLSAVAYQLATPFTVLLAWPLLAERPSLTTSAGVVLAFTGVVVLAAGPGLSANALPLLLVIGAAFSFAVSNVLTKRYGPFDPLMLIAWSSLLTVPQVLLMSLLLEYGQLASLVTADQRGWLALAYTIFVGGIAGFGLWFWLIARCSMARVAPFGLLLPVFALMSSVLFLGDRVTPKLIVGGLLAISGVAITQVRPSTRPV
jgi:O-acetylserine/cysteine efflux transporter